MESSSSMLPIFLILFSVGIIITGQVPSNRNISSSANVDKVNNDDVVSQVKISNGSAVVDESDQSTSKNIVNTGNSDEEDAEDKSDKRLLKVFNRKLDDSNLINTKIQKTPAITGSSPIVYTYRLNKGEEGKTCILMTVDAMLTFLYISKIGEKMETDMFVPQNIDVDGDCSDPDTSTMILRWKKYQLTIRFDKTPGGERWFVKNIQINFSTSDPKFNHIKYADRKITALSSEDDILFPTPVGNSFKCHREIVVGLMDPRYSDLKVQLLLREITIQPFIFKGEDFGPEYLCTIKGDDSFRSETMPFIFGSLLAACSVLTIAGYAVYRYFNVNKVQYHTME